MSTFFHVGIGLQIAGNIPQKPTFNSEENGLFINKSKLYLKDATCFYGLFWSDNW